MNKRKNQQGIALLTTVVVMAILVLVIGASVMIAISETETTQNSARSEQALNYAEAGIHWAAAKLRADPYFSTSTTSYLPSMAPSVSVGVRVINSSQSAMATIEAFSIIDSGGTAYPNASRAIRATFLLPKGVMPYGALFKRAITTNGKIETKNNATIHVSSALPSSDGIAILSNSPSSNAVVVGNGFSIDGKVGLMSGASYSDSLNGKTQTATPDPVPQLTEDQIIAWRNAAIADGTAKGKDHYFSTSQSWENGITLDGIYFINGDLEIDNKLNGQGTLVVNGKFTTKNKTEWSSTSMALIVTGAADLDMKNNASITGYIYVNGAVEFKNNMTLVGSIAARGNVIFGQNNATITFQNLGEGGFYNPAGFANANDELTPFSWQEIDPASIPLVP